MSQPFQKGTGAPGDDDNKKPRKLESRSKGKAAPTSTSTTQIAPGKAVASSSKPSTTSTTSTKGKQPAYASDMLTVPPFKAPNLVSTDRRETKPGESRLIVFNRSKASKGLLEYLAKIEPSAFTRSRAASLASSGDTSAATASSTRSLPSQTRDGALVVGFRRNPLKEGKEFLEFLSTDWVGRRNVLMIDQGQGGTFTNADPDTAEGKVLIAKHARNRVYPMTDENGKLTPNFVGTKGCITCIGVYFELDEKRFFCAHFDAWPVIDTFFDGPIGDNDRNIIIQEVIKQMERHSQAHGWSAKDLVGRRIIFVSPFPDMTDKAVYHGILCFLGLPWNPVIKCKNGFVVKPGAHASGIMVKYLNTTLDNNGRLIEQDGVPSEFTEINFNYPKTKQPMPQEFKFTIGYDWSYKAGGK